MCPECGAPLVAFEFNGVEIDHCVECGGTWLDKGELAMIAQQAGVEPGGMTKALYETETGGFGKGRCPRCGGRLRIVSIEGNAAIHLDRCPRGHGLYFDKGEMQAAVKHFTEGDDKEADAVARFFNEMFRHNLESEKEGGAN